MEILNVFYCRFSTKKSVSFRDVAGPVITVSKSPLDVRADCELSHMILPGHAL